MKGHCMTPYSIIEIQEGIQSLESLINKSEKALLKLSEGSSQRTLLTKRIKTFKMAYELLKEQYRQMTGEL